LIAWYLYATPPVTISLASVTFTPGSFMPHAEATELVVGSGWELYAIASGTLAAIIPWQLCGVEKVEKRIAAAGESVRTAEARGLQTQVVTKDDMVSELEKWGRGWKVNGILAAAGALVGAYSAAWL
jgi:hypothetical protein